MPRTAYSSNLPRLHHNLIFAISIYAQNVLLELPLKEKSGPREIFMQMEIKTHGRLSEKELLQKIKDCLSSHGFHLIKEVSPQGGKIYEFESTDMSMKLFCRFPPGNPSNVFVEFDIPAIAKKLKEAIGA